MGTGRILLVLLCFFPLFVWAALPVAVQDVRTIPVDVPVNVDVLTNDYDDDGDSLSVAIAEQPSNGRVQLNAGSGIQYTPNQGFTGQDRFTYTLISAGGDGEPESAVGTVIINVVPINLSNNVLSPNSSSVGQVLTSTCTQLGDAVIDDLSAGEAALASSCAGLVELALKSPEAAARAIKQITPEESLSLSKVGSNAFQAQSKIIANRMSQLSAGTKGSVSPGFLSLSMPVLGLSEDESGAVLSKMSVFSSVLIEDAEKAESLYEAGFDSSASGVTVGVDYAISSDWFAGAALGYTSNELEYHEDAGSVESQVYSLIAYTTYHVGGFNFDVQAGYGGSSIRTDRNINYAYLAGQYTRSTYGETNGVQSFASVQAQYLFSHNALTLYPSVKLGYGKSTIDEYADISVGGAGAWDVNIGEQNLEHVNVDVGLQGAYSISTSKGVVVPMFNVNAINNLRDDQEYTEATFAYAPEGSGSFMLIAEEGEQLFYRLGVGASMMMPNGFSFFVDVQKILGYTDYSATQYQLGFRKEL